MNNFAQLSAGEDVKFLVRWRGRQEGPHAASVIEAKLASNEIGLLHEIFHDGKWITIRDYVVEREAFLLAAQQARDEQERSAREETDRRAREDRRKREQQDQRQAELLAEDRREAARLESAESQKSHTGFPQTSPLPSADRGSPGLRTLGILLLIGGVAIAGYFFLAFDASVESAVGRVNNLGLMADRQNGVIVGIGLGIVGTILMISFRGKN